MTSRRFQVLIEHDRDDDAWVTLVPALDWLSTYGRTRGEALANTSEAILGYLEAAAKEGLPVPEFIDEAELVEIEVPAS
jgi:predicted RNase H-like HicB family nuclease